MSCWLTHVVSVDYLEARMWTWGRCCVRLLRRHPRHPSSPARLLPPVTTQEHECGPATSRRGLTLTSHLRSTLLLAETEATLSTSLAELRVSTVTKVNNIHIVVHTVQSSGNLDKTNYLLLRLHFIYLLEYQNF